MKEDKEELLEQETPVQEIVEENYKIKFRIPENFYVDTKNGEVFKATKDGYQRISPNLFWPVAVIHNIDDDTEKIKLLLEKRGEVKEGIFTKSVVYGSPIELSNFGVPINTTNSRQIIQYLAGLEADNEDRIPVIQSTSKFGWRGNVFVPFSKDSNIELDIDYKLQKWKNAYTSKGILKEWIEAIRPYRNNNIFRFELAASIAAPLLDKLGQRIFIIYNWGNSRAGKSSALKAALSVWGNPEELTLTFNTTAVGIERLAGLYNDLPLGLDEKQVNKSQSDIEKMIYMLGNGISRIRGNKSGGVQQINTWKTIVLATGEETISNTNTTTGIQTRCLEIEGSPYDNDEKLAASMYEIVSKYYGTAGPFFLEKLIEEYGADKFKGLKEDYQLIFEKIEKETSNDILSYVSSISVVVLADILMGKWLFNEDETKSYEMAFDILENLDNAKEIDIVDKCYEYIVSWIVGNHKSFDTYKTNIGPGYETTYNNLHPEEDLIETDRTKKSFGIYHDGVYYLLRYVLEDKLESKEYNYKKIVSEFAKRGYIKPVKDEEGNIVTTTTQKKYRGANTRMFAFPVEMMNKILSQEEKIESEKDYDAQLRGFKDNKEWEAANKELLNSLNINKN